MLNMNYMTMIVYDCSQVILKQTHFGKDEIWI